MENGDDGKIDPRKKMKYHMKEKLGVIARINENVSKVNIKEDEEYTRSYFY